jgi:hypothetical protein
MKSKMMLTLLGLAALVATPALAKPAHRAQVSSGAYASVNEPVVSDGRVIGTDPDPSIRFELQRDSSTYTSTN